MGKIKIGLAVLISIAVVGLVVGGVVTAKNGSENGKAKFVQDEIIVKFKGDVKPFRVIKIPESKVGEKVREYLKRADVEYAEPNYIAYALMVPNDPYYKYQWHLDNKVYGGIQMEEAWDVSTGAGVTVAVVDTGIRKGTDLANTCFVSGYDFVNSDNDPTDDNGHGTHVAGTVAQSTDNKTGVAGVAFNSCLMPVKVLDSSGSGYYSDVADGIYWAVDNGAEVINLSLGGSEPSSALEEAVAYAYNNGVTVVAAAGNDGEGGAPSYPAAYNDYVIAVGATQYDETRAPYSTTGSYLDLVAPGGNNNLDQNGDGYADGVLQQTFTKTGRRISWAYYFFQGTSMASPHVAGTAALVIANGITGPDNVRAALETTAEEKGTTSWDEIYGWGLVDAYAALGWTAAPVIACSSDTECDDGNLCTTDVCLNPGTVNAYCQNTAVADGTTCDDGLFCTVNDVCMIGVCGGVAKDCSDNVACTIDSCNEVNDVCVNTPDDSYCDDNLYCNGEETCDATLGCQAGTLVNCDDSNECTVDSCNEDIEACKNTLVADNTLCADGVCCSGVCTIGITECLAAPTMYVGDILMSGSCIGRGPKVWCKATATVTITDGTTGVSDATVYGSWSGAYTADVSGITGTDGKITFGTSLVKGSGTFNFCVTDVTKTDWIYNSEKNVETCDSITVTGSSGWSR